MGASLCTMILPRPLRSVSGPATCAGCGPPAATCTRRCCVPGCGYSAATMWRWPKPCCWPGRGGKPSRPRWRRPGPAWAGRWGRGQRCAGRRGRGQHWAGRRGRGQRGAGRRCLPPRPPPCGPPRSARRCCSSPPTRPSRPPARRWTRLSRCTPTSSAGSRPTSIRAGSRCSWRRSRRPGWSPRRWGSTGYPGAPTCTRSC